MKFYVVKRRENLPPRAECPCFRVERDTWDDFGFCTLFHLTYYSGDRQPALVGQTKIMQGSANETTLDKVFENLGDSFCSLGQDVEFYERIREFFPDNWRQVLDPLNDVAANPGLLDRFEGERAFRTSLLRFSEASKALAQGLKILDGRDYKEPFHFTYSCQLGTSTLPHKVEFRFDKNSSLPFRIVALVGKNGTGKTQYLASLASDLSGQKRVTSNSGTFSPSRPPFGKVIAIAYSAFDQFARPSSTRTFSYHYCGLHNDKGLMPHTRMVDRFLESVKRVRELDRVSEWSAFVSTAVDPSRLELLAEMVISGRVDRDAVKYRSSGETILLYVLTEIMANIRDESLLLFDEPEMHLHPNATASLIRGIDRILSKYDSYAILATHSPIILQEIPSDSVLVFARQGDVPMIRMLDIESFGENLSTLTEHVFETIEIKANFKEVLKRLAQEHSYGTVLGMFRGRLSFNAKMFLKAQYSPTPNEET